MKKSRTFPVTVSVTRSERYQSVTVSASLTVTLEPADHFDAVFQRVTAHLTEQCTCQADASLRTLLERCLDI
jgi:hypothetical protein